MPINIEDRRIVDEKKERKQRTQAEIHTFFTLKTPQYSREDMVFTKELEIDLLEIIGYVKHSDKVYKEWGLERVIKANKGVFINLYGPSGTGKTMMANIIANELNKKILQVDYAQIESKYVGETSKNLETLFKIANKEDNILFFDEADALLSKRVTDMSSAADVSVNQTRSVLLKLIDDYQGVCIFATNFISNYDVAFLRRITKFVKFHNPDSFQRKMLWNHYLVRELPNTINVDEIVSSHEDISGSDIKNAVLSSAIRTAALGKTIVTMEMIEQVLEEIETAKKEQDISFNYQRVEEGDK